MKIFTWLTIIISLITSSQISAQEDYTWWNIKHNWDGISSWHEMIILSPSFMGPNALPVAEGRDGTVSKDFKIKITPEAHISKGDNTIDFKTSLTIPLKGAADFEVWIVPVEYYVMDTITRDLRFARHEDGKGFAGGDFYFGTNIKVLKHEKHKVDLSFSTYLKTASGTYLSDARFTDAPGYQIFISFGKNIIEKTNYRLRLYGNAGTFIYQTMLANNLQNDCYLYALGLESKSETIVIKGELAGYYGYLNIGDKPMVFRFIASKSWENFSLGLNYQLGICYFPYQSFGLSLQRNFNFY